MSRAYVYVDGFNLYYRALRRSSHKWLDINALANRLLRPEDNVERIRYFTARVSSRSGDPDAPRRQQLYLSALSTLPNVEVHYGRFLAKTKRRPLVSNPTQYVEVHDTEEKGSDVNLASHLLNDGWKGMYDIALILSQDTDLIEPIRMAREEIGKVTGLIWLDGGQPNTFLVAAASFIRHAKNSDFATSQFPNPIHRNPDPPIHKPVEW